jgi:site-specific recombinase XerD
VPRGRPGAFDRSVFLGRRDEVVLRLLLDAGVRVSELCGLELTDVDRDRELAYVTGKGSRPRVVPFGAKTAQAVDRYLRVRALHPYARSPRLLLGQRGPMTPDGARAPHRPASLTSTRTASGTPSPTAGSPAGARSGT